MELSQTATRFILHWGEMGSRWGVNRTVAQIHALLYLSDRPLHAEEISETLVLARSNVSVALKELQTWGLVRMTHVLGDRRDHFDALQDIWEMFRVLVAERRKREIEPTMTFLRDCVLTETDGKALSAEAQTHKVHLKKMESMLDFLQTITEWSDEMEKIPPSTLRKLMRMGTKIQAFMK